MRFVVLITVVLWLPGIAESGDTVRESSKEPYVQKNASLVGKTIEWTFEDGPMPGTRYEHTFNEDGSVVWRVMSGPMSGKSARVDTCAVVSVAEAVQAVSYLSESGYTLTVVLNMETGRAHGFASNDKEWHPLTGTFRVSD